MYNVKLLKEKNCFEFVLPLFKVNSKVDVPGDDMEGFG
jgi:hypothetical protein